MVTLAINNKENKLVHLYTILYLSYSIKSPLIQTKGRHTVSTQKRWVGTFLSLLSIFIGELPYTLLDTRY